MKQYVDRPSSEPACLELSDRIQACRSGESAITAEAFVNNARYVLLLIKTTSRFLKDLMLAKKRGYDIDKLEAIVDHLQTQKPLPPKSKNHHLSGEWNHHRECHIQPDWLLIYRIEATFLILERTGTHVDLFDRR